MGFLWALVLLSVVGTTAACPDGFFSHDTSCYVIPDQTASWPEAKMYCQAVGADLAIIETRDENNMLGAHVNAGQASYGSMFFWLDGADYTKEGGWIWTRTGQPLGLNFWANGQPDNLEMMGQREHCLVLTTYYVWDDAHCNDDMKFICEMPNANVPVVG